MLNCLKSHVKHILTETSRVMFAQISGCCGLVRWHVKLTITLRLPHWCADIFEYSSSSSLCFACGLSLLMGFFWVFFSLILQRENQDREKERNISVWERYWSVSSHTHPGQEWNLHPSFVSWPGREPATLWCTGWPSQQLSLQDRAAYAFYIIY